MSRIADPESVDLDHYEPREGLKTIALSAAAEKLYEKAKDRTQLFKAIKLKLTEQRKFVLWWDKQSRKGGNPTVTGLKRLADLGTDRISVHRWRSKLKDELKFIEALERANDRCIRICEYDKGQTDQRGASGTGENEWHTPSELIELVRTALGSIDLDPASSEIAQVTVRASHYFTAENDGLTQEWAGNVFLNPPYSQPLIAQFADKMAAEWQRGFVKQAIILTHNYTDTTWFQKLAWHADAICFPRGRVKFVSATGEVAAPTQGQALVYYGDPPLRQNFLRTFINLGLMTTIVK